ncbi:flavin reductase family protein [Dictyobacter formicarum]|uniref:Flavin reductase n=1 Tax=Dictyobacter formicarum TaxID=2778368 RepID=A0ABQ3VAR1_9CHLR|nr:flavin reductase family protein [Dictyobacter formicarum]GHO82972.1 flavin reductase [Dictyobacter formicarum]
MDPAVKKQALRTFTYGLYVVMSKEDEVVNAFTANWLTQVSFEPPLIAVSIENDAKSLSMIQHSQAFTINVLKTGQRDLAGQLGRSYNKNPDKLAGISYSLQQDTYPVLNDALAWITCKVQNTMPAGDSTLIIAEVIDAGVQAEGASLTMNEAGFRHAG